MKIRIIQDKVGLDHHNKYMEFVKGDLFETEPELANELILMGVAEIYQPSAVKIQGKNRLHKASVK